LSPLLNESSRFRPSASSILARYSTRLSPHRPSYLSGSFNNKCAVRW
jgi:hypothetical protein